MKSYYCSKCGTFWPHHPQAATCPVCEVPCNERPGMPGYVLSVEQANEQLAYYGKRLEDEAKPEFTYRCSICGINWPYYKPLASCPICGEACHSYRLPDHDHALTIDEANELLAAHGQKIYPRPDRDRKKLKPKGRKPTVEELAVAHRELDDWARRFPW